MKVMCQENNKRSAISRSSVHIVAGNCFMFLKEKSQFTDVNILHYNRRGSMMSEIKNNCENRSTFGENIKRNVSKFSEFFTVICYTSVCISN